MAVTQKEVDEVWTFCDLNGDGHITFDEFYDGFNKYVQSKTKGKSVKQESVSYDFCRRMFSGIDHSNDEKITKRELETELLERDERREGLLRDFKQCAGKDGKISMDELRAMIGQSKCIPSSQFDSFTAVVFEKADRDGSGFLDFDEFEKVMNEI